MSHHIKSLLFSIVFLFCANFAMPNLMPQTPDSTSALHWIEKHPVLFASLVGLVTALIGAWVTWSIARRSERKAPQIAKASKKAEKEAEREYEEDIQIIATDETERRYLNGVKAEHDTIKLYGFQSSANLKVSTLEVFVPLRLTEEWRGERSREVPEREDGRHLTPEQVLQRAFRKKRLLLIIGDPGSGKTTLLKYYSMCCLDEKGRQKLGLRQPLLPIFLPLRKVDPSKPFEEALSAWATKKNWHVSPQLFDQWLEKRGALVMLDGLDEISDIGLRKQVCEWIDNACDYYRNSCFVVTSRYAGYRVSEGIELRTDHLRADVLDLSPAQQEIFLKKWFKEAYKEEIDSSELSRAEQEKALEVQAQEVADAVLKYLAQEENAGLRQMAGTPVLLQIMAILWKEFGNLPPSRADLYERCIDYLLDRRDREKDIPVLLPADQAKIVLRPVCLWMQEIRKSDEATANELEEKMAPLLEEVKSGLAPQDFINNLCDRAGIIQEFGDGGYIFRHKSFREFLAASQLAEEVKEKPERVNILVENFQEGWWRETLVFALSLPRPVIFKDFMKSFLPHRHNAAGFPPLLEQVIREARQKSIEPFETFLLDRRQPWQKRHNALQCLRLIASEPAKALVQKIWQQERNKRLKQKAEEILIEWKLHRPPVAQVVQVEAAKMLVKSFRNPFELEAEYILIPGGKYKYSVTGEEIKVPSLYFAKYPLTNKLYRRFIDYLAAKQSMREMLAILPTEQFAQSLLKKAAEIEGFLEYLGENPSEWADTLR
ncbi:MAG: NACHT domain-containing protein, partial [candidate division KSB1 bacterium]|nr:NACHT domain-containing protein [candidate division KSB1 bacterium]